MIEKFTVSRDDNIYEAWPCLVLLPSGKMVCVFVECTHHGDRSYTRIMLADSQDRGRTWTPKRPLTKGTKGFPFWNNPRISLLRDNRLAVICDRLDSEEKSKRIEDYRNFLFFSSNEGISWSEPIETPALGIVPDKLLELSRGRWIISCHGDEGDFGYLTQRLWYSDDQGQSWSDPVIVARQENFNFCEASILPVNDNTLVAFLRENSSKGRDCFKTISHNCGESWSEPIRFPLPGCHRPVAGFLNDGKIMITHRFMQGGKGWLGSWTQNFFAAITDIDSVLALKRNDGWTRILPIDFDRSSKSDTGYSGWVQFDDGEIFIVNYIKDDSPKCQIRGYSLWPKDFLID
jgi:hypothetical protein